MADVPLGMFLSGGLDSSAIAALMARMIDRPLADLLGRVRAARVQRARLRAAGRDARSGADAHEIVIDEQDFFGALPRLVWHEDEPIAHPSSVPLYFVSKLASEHVKVVLTGEGSDELLAGYGKYPRALVNWRAGAVSGSSRRSRCASSSPTRSCRGCPAALGALRDAIVPRDAAHARGDVLRQLRRDRAARGRRRCSTPRSRALATPEPPTARRAPTSTRRTAAARRSIGCSTPTSRRTWSSC